MPFGTMKFEGCLKYPRDCAIRSVRKGDSVVGNEPGSIKDKYPSLDYIHDRIKEYLDTQLGSIKRMDSKAVGILAVDVAAMALILDKEKYFVDYWYLGLAIMLFFACSLVSCLFAISAVKLHMPPNPDVLYNKYLDKKADYTKYNVTRAYAAAYLINEATLKRKMRKFGFSIGFLVAAIIVMIPSAFVICL